MFSAKNKTVDQLEIEEQSKPESHEEKPSSWLTESEGDWIYKFLQIYNVQFSKSKSNHLRSANRLMRDAEFYKAVMKLESWKVYIPAVEDSLRH